LHGGWVHNNFEGEGEAPPYFGRNGSTHRRDVGERKRVHTRWRLEGFNKGGKFWKCDAIMGKPAKSASAKMKWAKLGKKKAFY